MFAKFEKKNIEEILFKQTTWIVVGKVFFFQYKSRLSCSETKTRPSIDNFRLLTDQNVSNQCFLFVFVISSLTMCSLTDSVSLSSSDSPTASWYQGQPANNGGSPPLRRRSRSGPQLSLR